MNKVYHNSKCFDVLRSRSAFCYVSVDWTHPKPIPENARERPKRFQDQRQWPACETPQIRIDGPPVLKPEPLVPQALSSPKKPSRPSQYHNLAASSWQLAPFFCRVLIRFVLPRRLPSTQPSGSHRTNKPTEPSETTSVPTAHTTLGASVTERVPEGLLQNE
jgi:hypothetical protein